MKSSVTHSLCGAVAAVCARLFLTGQHDFGYLGPAILGAIGGFLADRIGRKAGLYSPDGAASFAMSMLGAMAVLVVYGALHL